MLKFDGFRCENAYSALVRLQWGDIGTLGVQALGNIVNGQVIEVTGPAGSGKSQVLYEACVQCILPVKVGGLQKKAAFIDCDRKLSIPRIVEMMEDKLHEDMDMMTDEMVNDVVLECLDRLLVYEVDDTEEIVEAVKLIEKYMQDDFATLHLICVDAIDTFYWNDRASSAEQDKSWKPILMNLHGQMAKTIERVVTEQYVVCLVSKLSIAYTSKEGCARSVNVMQNPWQAIVNKQVTLEYKGDSTVLVQYSDTHESQTMQYTLNGLRKLDICAK